MNLTQRLAHWKRFSTSLTVMSGAVSLDDRGFNDTRRHRRSFANDAVSRKVMDTTRAMNSTEDIDLALVRQYRWRR